MKKKVRLTLSFLFIGLLATGLSSCMEHTHTFTEQVIVKNPTCTEPGAGYFYCPEDETRTQDLPIAPLGHAMAIKTIAPTCTEQGYDVHYCTRCGLEISRDNFVEPKGHAYHTAVVPPTCTEKGYTIYDCECGDDHHIGDYVDALGHDYVDTIIAPTCTQKGHTEHKCSRCGDFYIDSYTNPLGHDLHHHDGKEPTCEEDGWHSYDTCSRCDYSTYEPIPAFGHHYRKTVIAPTCTEEGHTHYECLVCGEERDGDVVPALGHDYINYPEEKATCLEAGHKAYHVCARCGDSNYEEIPPLGGEHEYTERVVLPTRSSRGYTLHTCTHCGVTYKSDFVAPLTVSSIISADQALSSSLISEDELVYSSRDDDFYYYAVYQGHVSNFIFHSLYEFSWSENMGKLGTYPKTREPAKPMDVLENYQAYQSFWGQNIQETLLAAIPFPGTFQAIPNADDKIIAKANDLLLAEGKGDLLEASDPSLANLSASIDALGTSYAPGKNLDQYEDGVQYAYAAAADFDLYIAVAYDIANETFSYRLCASLTSQVKELFLATTNGSYGDVALGFDVSTDASARMDVPTNYETNHPLKIYEWKNANKINVPALGEGRINYTINGADELYSQGYDTIYITFNFYMNCGGIFSSSGATFYVEIINKDDGAVLSATQFSVTKGNPHYEKVSVTAVSTLFPEGKITFRSVWKSGFAYDLTVTGNMYLYNSVAKGLGAYAGTPVG